MWLWRPVRLLATVALEPPLFDVLSGLRPNRAVMSVRELAFLGLVDRPPFGADIDPAADANPLTGLTCRCLRIGHDLCFHGAVGPSDCRLPPGQCLCGHAR